MNLNGQDASGQQPFDPERPYTPGQDPVRDAWYTTFFIENHLDYYAYPDHVDSPEQVRFMVYTEGSERYYPCSDSMFGTIMRREKSPLLQKKYEAVLNRMLNLIDEQIEDPWDKSFLMTLIKTKYVHETRDALMIPSRLEKRLLKIYIDRTQIQDPYLAEKKERNKRACHALNSEVFQKALNHVDTTVLESPPTSLIEIRERVEFLKLSRLFTLSVDGALWDSDDILEYTAEDYLELFNRSFSGDGVEILWKFLRVKREGASGIPQSKKILWLADEAGEVIVDLAIVRYLAQLGHKIIMAFKDGPLFKKIDFFDAQEEETLRRELEGTLLIHEKNLEKNELVNVLKGDKNVMAISDGTRENLNLLFVSTTFARVFKEVDGVISKGLDQRRRIFHTHFRFTQDIYSISRDEDGSTSILYKAKHPEVIKFSHKDLERKAGAIISEMEKAKQEGMTVMFYSGIIGSIPGKEAMAKKIMSTYTQYLTDQSTSTFIINPAEYFESGMDADDLMYMWEIVQRSGLIDIWRFQRYDDIVEAFEIMKMKIPPEWVGKDATFSTGCTKEMKIALEVQEKHREMQIIGPSREKFLRRQEYGIGKMYDRQLDEICVC
jgi:uncharacterized protein with ATP-grasp and redox domains